MIAHSTMAEQKETPRNRDEIFSRNQMKKMENEILNLTSIVKTDLAKQEHGRRAIKISTVPTVSTTATSIKARTLTSTHATPQVKHRTVIPHPQTHSKPTKANLAAALALDLGKIEAEQERLDQPDTTTTQTTKIRLDGGFVGLMQNPTTPTPVLDSTTITPTRITLQPLLLPPEIPPTSNKGFGDSFEKRKFQEVESENEKEEEINDREDDTPRTSTSSFPRKSTHHGMPEQATKTINLKELVIPDVFSNNNGEDSEEDENLFEPLRVTIDRESKKDDIMDALSLLNIKARKKNISVVKEAIDERFTQVDGYREEKSNNDQFILPTKPAPKQRTSEPTTIPPPETGREGLSIIYLPLG